MANEDITRSRFRIIVYRSGHFSTKRVLSTAKQEKKRRKRKKKNDVHPMDRARRSSRQCSRLSASFVQVIFLFFSLLLFSFFSSPSFYLEIQLRSRHLTVHGILPSAVSRVDGECFEWVLKHEASACHRARTTRRILADGEKTRVKRRERVRQWSIHWITSASYISSHNLQFRFHYRSIISPRHCA